MDVQLAGVTTALRRTPATLRALLAGLPDAWCHADEGQGTFSARDVLGHLIHGERTDWVPRLRIIIEHGEARPFTPFDRFAFRDAIRGVTTAALLDEFGVERARSLAALEALRLQPADLARTGTHPELGRVTAGQLLATWVVHDLGHLRQAARVLAKQYRDAVGPWSAYLHILHE